MMLETLALMRAHRNEIAEALFTGAAVRTLPFRSARLALDGQ